MTTNAWVQIGLYIGVLLAYVKPLGLYMARIYQGRPGLAGKLLSPLERMTYLGKTKVSGEDKGVREKPAGCD